jgi:hypothetical protein
LASNPDPYSFSDLLHASRSELREALATTVAQLCTELETCAFIRATDGRNSEYYEHEGHRDALTEQKWLILKLIDTIDSFDTTSPISTLPSAAR